MPILTIAGLKKNSGKKATSLFLWIRQKQWRWGLKLRKLKPSDNFEGDRGNRNRKAIVRMLPSSIPLLNTKKRFDFIQSVFNPAATQLLNNYKCAQANILKPGKTGIHGIRIKNLTIVDEARYTSLSFWTPLQDTGNCQRNPLRGARLKLGCEIPQHSMFTGLTLSF